MKGIINFFATFVLAANLSLFASVFAAATSAPHFFISRVNATNGAEFIEIFNDSPDIEVSNLTVKQGVAGRDIFSKPDFIFRGNDYFLIRQSGSGEAHGFFDGNQISEKAILRIYINDELVAYICAESAAQCAKAGVSKNSTDLKGSGVAVNFFEIPSLKIARDKYEFKLLSDKEIDAVPVADGFMVEEIIDATIDDEGDGGEENAEESPETEGSEAGAIAIEDVVEPENNKGDDMVDIGKNLSSESVDNKESADGGEGENGEGSVGAGDIEGESTSGGDFDDTGGVDSLGGGESGDRDGNNKDSSELSDTSVGDKLEGDSTAAANPCLGLKFSEILVNSSDGFFEIINTSSENILLSNCSIRYKNVKKTFALPDVELASGEIFALKFAETTLKPAKTTAGEFRIIDSDGREADFIAYEKTLAEESVIVLGDDILTTFQPTFNAENILKIEKECSVGYAFDFEAKKCSKLKIEKLPAEKTCANGYFVNPETNRCKKIVEEKTASKTSSKNEKALAECKIGYERNLETNRCRKIASPANAELAPCKDGYERSAETNRCRKIGSGASTQTPCKEGYYRSEETGRCRKVATASDSNLKECGEGYYRSLETNRCRKISASTSGELVPCKEGYERNPETNRCRKVVKNESASDAVAESVEVERRFDGWWAIWLVAGLTGVIAGWEFRTEIFAIFAKIFRRRNA